MSVVRSGPGCLLQFLWFVFVGWWLGFIWVAIAWLLNLTLIGLPLGVWMLNRIPQVMLLRDEPCLTTVVRAPDGSLVLRQSELPQRPWWLRALWFLLIGWWLSLLWLLMAWLLCGTIILLPLGMAMFDRVPAVVSLRRT